MSATWGSIQLSGAVHQMRDAVIAGATVPLPGPFLPAFADTEYGFAIGLQGSFNLPFFGAGDAIWYALASPTAPSPTSTAARMPRPRFDPLGRQPRPARGRRVRERVHRRPQEDDGLVDRRRLHPLLDARFRTPASSAPYARFDAPGVATTVNFVPGTSASAPSAASWTSTNSASAPTPSGRRSRLQTRRRVHLHQHRSPRPRARSGDRHYRRRRRRREPSGEDIWEGRLRIQRDFSKVCLTCGRPHGLRWQRRGPFSLRDTLPETDPRGRHERPCPSIRCAKADARNLVGAEQSFRARVAGRMRTPCSSSSICQWRRDSPLPARGARPLHPHNRRPARPVFRLQK